MPYVYDPYRAPVGDPGGPFIDDPTIGPKTGGGSGAPFTSPGVPSFGGGGGGAGGYYFGEGYQPFGGYSPFAVQRRRRGYGQTAMAGGGRSGPQAAPAPPWMGGGSSMGATRGEGGGRDYWDVLMDRFSGADTGYTHAAGTDAEALADMIIGGQGRGAFGPEGDPRIMRQLMAEAQRRGLDLEQAAVLGSRVEGADPWTQGLSSTLARANAQRGRAQLGAQVGLDQANRYNDLLMNLFRRKLGQFDTEKERGWQLEDESRARDRANKAFAWQLAGQVAGSAIPGLKGGGKASGASGGSMAGAPGGGGADDIWKYLAAGGF